MPVIQPLPSIGGIGPLPRHTAWADMTTNELVEEIEAIGDRTTSIETKYYPELVLMLAQNHKTKLLHWFRGYLAAWPLELCDDPAMLNMHHVLDKLRADVDHAAFSAIQAFYKKGKADTKALNQEFKSDFKKMVTIRHKELKAEKASIHAELMAEKQRRLIAKHTNGHNQSIQDEESFTIMKANLDADRYGC
ncbi:hypothetical protein DL95DRAFT_413636 [Leptodontidium sp. 2 PMI_412]|nr:hypothetical protein DL95DRAFT_413636 [Leptodontidium sp. 2 PMI_412]